MSTINDAVLRAERALGSATPPAGSLRTVRLAVAARVDSEGSDALTVTVVLPDDVTDDEIALARLSQKWVKMRSLDPHEWAST